MRVDGSFLSPAIPKRCLSSMVTTTKRRRLSHHSLRRTLLSPSFLADQPNAGRTVFEKFEDYGDVGFAIILLTADDIGRAKAGPAADCNRGPAKMSSWKWVTLWPSSEEAAFAHSSRMELRLPPTYPASSPLCLSQIKSVHNGDAIRPWTGRLSMRPTASAARGIAHHCSRSVRSCLVVVLQVRLQQ